MRCICRRESARRVTRYRHHRCRFALVVDRHNDQRIGIATTIAVIGTVLPDQQDIGRVCRH